MQYTNRLVNETSPYLLQHAHNPVDWHPWGEEALKRAIEEDKPILVSIGYAACHWCHVMEKESFEDAGTAKLMNEHFINIKIDREERPDLDHIYMDAVQAMTGSGGWPLNVFLTPGRKPFYGGTYFPPKNAYGRASWQEVLKSVSHAFREKRNEIEEQADYLTKHLSKANSFGFSDTKDQLFSDENLATVFEQLMKQADTEWGGFGKAPKFPQTFSIRYLLRHYHFTGSSDALKQALLSLDKMIEGGIYDQIGGGFARYATDTEWLAPHFEKMLYDNALLISVISEAYQLTGNLRYKEVIEETLEFIQREMLHESDGFYAALDADSEGVEGKYYVWTEEEIRKALGNTGDLFCEYYDVTKEGNWEGVNILRVKKPLGIFAVEKERHVEALHRELSQCRKKLLEIRGKRIRPLLDDKIILGWNALMNSACSHAFAATGNETYKELAIRNMSFLLEQFSMDENGAYWHTWKNGQGKYPAFLDDYAFLIEALLNIYRITGNADWLEKANQLTGYVVRDFSEEGTGFFFYTPAGQQDVIFRKKEVYDGAVPSGNSVMARNLLHLSIIFSKPEWKERAVAILRSLSKAVITYPSSFGNWACLLQELVPGTHEIVILEQEGRGQALSAAIAKYIPCSIIVHSSGADIRYPILVGKTLIGNTTIYLCRNYTCLQPVFSVEELMLLINKGKE